MSTTKRQKKEGTLPGIAEQTSTALTEALEGFLSEREAAKEQAEKVKAAKEKLIVEMKKMNRFFIRHADVEVALEVNEKLTVTSRKSGSEANE